MKHTITKCLELLLLDLSYAIERNIDSIDIPLQGDVDILITFPDYVQFVRRAGEQDLLISVARVYGGARVYLECFGGLIKRVDFIWRLHYRGINLLDVRELISKRVLSATSDLYVLPEYEQAQVVFYIKNSYGGASKYRSILQKHGFDVLSPAARRKMLMTVWARYARQTMVGVSAYWLSYISRVWRPSGLTISGITSDRARRMVTLAYLFQGRIREDRARLKVIFGSRFLSELCVTGDCRAELILDDQLSDSVIERAVITYLRNRVNHDL